MEQDGHLCSLYIFAVSVTVSVEEAWKDWRSVPKGSLIHKGCEIRLIPEHTLRYGITFYINKGKVEQICEY